MSWSGDLSFLLAHGLMRGDAAVVGRFLHHAQKLKQSFDAKFDSKLCSAVLWLSKGSASFVVFQQTLLEFLERPKTPNTRCWPSTEACRTLTRTQREAQRPEDLSIFTFPAH